ncbi:hypothetical protein CCHOA_00940 [Corynebacterium choanae]|uniref:Uncharacterized protein n=2 Tax=Corynebacterium choanae TaxID=1862358 RepID=A0A3G6J3V2_9CORY|nr:hypothetical protein CCHOA_00940 [Corynebacterium choanae]
MKADRTDLPQQTADVTAFGDSFAHAGEPVGAVNTARQITPAAAQSNHGATTDVPPAVVANGIAVYGGEGVVYGPLNVEIPGVGLTILTGRGGSGRTALALTLSGRMKIAEGELTVLGETKRSAIRKRVAIAGVDEIDAIDRDVKLKTVITEHRAWSSGFLRWITRADDDYYRSLCGDIFGDRDLPPLDAYVSQISALDRYLIRIALALAPVGGHEIGMLVMDDLEQVHEFSDRIILVNTLARLAERFPVVVNAVNPLPQQLVANYTLIELFTDAGHLSPEHDGRPKHLPSFLLSESALLQAGVQAHLARAGRDHTGDGQPHSTETGSRLAASSATPATKPDRGTSPAAPPPTPPVETIHAPKQATDLVTDTAQAIAPAELAPGEDPTLAAPTGVAPVQETPGLFTDGDSLPRQTAAAQSDHPVTDTTREE